MNTGRILLTGATGYVGGRLLAALAGGGRRVRCLVRDEEAFRPGVAGVEVVEGDCLKAPTLPPVLEGFDRHVPPSRSRSGRWP